MLLQNSLALMSFHILAIELFIYIEVYKISILLFIVVNILKIRVVSRLGCVPFDDVIHRIQVLIQLQPPQRNILFIRGMFSIRIRIVHVSDI